MWDFVEFLDSYFIILFFLSICICLLAAFEFKSIAEIKGHGGMKYFWYCLFAPFFGMLMVVALPDRTSTTTGENKIGAVSSVTDDQLPSL